MCCQEKKFLSSYSRLDKPMIGKDLAGKSGGGKALW